MSWLNYIRTVKHLKPIQIYSRVALKLQPMPRCISSAPALRPRFAPWIPPIGKSDPRLGPFCFRFLNDAREPSSWNDAAIPKLWLYNLNYFDHPHLDLIERWIIENPPGMGIGWDPYPLSLRIVNWIKLALNGHPLPSKVLDSVAVQADYLSQRLEYHLLANHLFSNAKALVFAGLLFSGLHAERWLRTGIDLLNREIPEQIGPDGGHIEQSPMYQALVFEDLLDLINISHAYPGLCPNWALTAGRMLSWLRNMIHPDGRIAFFNDSAFGIAPEFQELCSYASRLGICEFPVPLSSSGYVRLAAGDTTVLFDAGPLGPDYQLAHAHADTLSFELSHRGRRLLVNSGTSTYQAGAERQRQRSTAAHNTIRVDGKEQSEIWSVFRVGSRARPLDLQTDGRTFAEAAHDGYLRLSSPVIHRRRIEVSPKGARITDSLEGRGRHSADLFFHIHPGAEVSIIMDDRLLRTTERSSYHPHFGVSVPNHCVVGRWAGLLPVQFITHIPLDGA